jgi:glycosyltransferase involved in cell wall biosynthesis
MKSFPVSIIVCTYNRANLLFQIVRELRAQEYRQGFFEIIVVDNGSDDQTRKVVRQFATQSSVDIIYVYESRRGITHARNRGAREARYPYLAYIDDDCRVTPQWLGQLMSGFELDAHVGAVGGAVIPVWQQPKPAWLGPQIEHWFASTSFLGSKARLLDKGERIVEGNMAIEYEAWREAGGFLGMDRFGSQNMASGEILYLLHQVYKQGKMVAFNPGAVAWHCCINKPSKRWMVRRAYWQGVSDAMLDHILHQRSLRELVMRFSFDILALFTLLVLSAAGYLGWNQRKGMYQLARAVRRVGLLLGEARIVGDWSAIRSWLYEHAS